MWISITAQAFVQEAVAGRQVAPARPLRIAFEGAAGTLPESFRRELARGLASAIPARLDDQSITVTVLEVSYPELDFQEDGLAVAMCRWAEDEFGLPPRHIDVSYDRVENRYVFGWH